MRTKIKNSIPALILALPLGLLLLISCSTDKNTLVHRGFHNMTARYNGYFYAKESIKEGAGKLGQSHKDDYTRVLPVYKLGNVNDSKNIYPEMDKAYKKASTVIQRHSIFIRGHEYCSWIDDNYLLIGISHYFKRDFFAAIEIFEYITLQYKTEEIRYDAMIWMLRAYNEAAIVSKAQVLIDFIRNEKKFPHRLKKDFNIALADFYLKQENYSQAIESLKKSIESVKPEINKENYKQFLKRSHAPRLAKNKAQKTRLMFILAQLYQKENEHESASKYFSKVVKRNPEYEMAFQAKINQAKSYDVNSKSNKNIKEQLLKMLKEEKNNEYFDQIYYALAEIAFRENQTEVAIDYLKNSVLQSVSNSKQKAFSYLKLADYYFQKTDYPVSFSYYDSALTVLPKDYLDYEKYENKKNSLGKAVKNINTINREDSLQKIASLNEQERDVFIENLIDVLVKKEEEKKKQEEEQKLAAQSNASGNFNPNSSSGIVSSGSTGAWYFYNTSSISMGFAEFAKKWGDRPLEDNWRRQNKEKVMAELDTEEEEQPEVDSLSGVKKSKLDQLKNKDNYLKDLPLSAEKMNKSRASIVEAYYNLGTIYKEDLNDMNSSIASFETLNKRFPQNKYLLPVYYQLYRSNLQLNNEPKADHYKNILLNEFPESPYSKLIKNPEYAKESMAARNEVERLYEVTYQLYDAGKYDLLLKNCALSHKEFPKNFLAAKFDLLNAMALGKTKGSKEFEEALKTLIIKYPKDPVKERAEELLNYLHSLKPIEKPVLMDSLYKFSPEAPHFCILIFSKTKSLNDLTVALSDFNNNYFSTENYTSKNLFFDVDNQMLAISTFSELKKAKIYLNALKEESFLISIIGSEYTSFLISDVNFPIFLKEKGLIAYLDFYNKVYK